MASLIVLVVFTESYHTQRHTTVMSILKPNVFRETEDKSVDYFWPSNLCQFTKL